MVVLSHGLGRYLLGLASLDIFKVSSASIESVFCDHPTVPATQSGPKCLGMQVYI